MDLPRGIRFERGRGFKKYTAIMPNGKRVSFGDMRYQHFKDSVPRALGGGLWTHLNHGDAARRRNYRQRHGSLHCKDGRRCVSIQYSPAWFSYYFLW